MSVQKKPTLPRVIVPMLLIVVVVPLLPLLISGRWGWWEAWVYFIVCVLGFVVSRILASRRSPDLLAERSRFMQHEDAKPWDRLLAPLVSIGGGLIPLVAGLDARFGWSAPGGASPFGSLVKALALLVLLASYALGAYALIENRFFSGMVRIQKDRGQRVISTGPYAWVRHPGYAGALLTYLATPFFLDSLWALLPLALLVVALVIRTRLEDQTLQNELEGYREYAGRVRYRLIPGVW